MKSIVVNKRSHSIPAFGGLSVTPLTGSIGARIDGIKLKDTTAHDVEVIRAALLKHCMLVFPEQFMGPQDHVAFSEKMGDLYIFPRVDFGDLSLPSGILKLINDGKDKVITENWHFDGMYLEAPPSICILAAQELPSIGGDTMWNNQYLAYETLSDGMKRLIRNLRYRYVSSRIQKRYEGNNEQIGAWQPAVRKHPETGRHALYVGSPETCRHFDGMTEAESRPIIQYLYAHAQRPDFGCRHIWHGGDVVIWDNRCTMHYAVHDYGVEPRVMHRMAIKGDVARGPD